MCVSSRPSSLKRILFILWHPDLLFSEVITNVLFFFTDLSVKWQTHKTNKGFLIFLFFQSLFKSLCFLYSSLAKYHTADKLVILTIRNPNVSEYKYNTMKLWHSGCIKTMTQNQRNVKDYFGICSIIPHHHLQNLRYSDAIDKQRLEM